MNLKEQAMATIIKQRTHNEWFRPVSLGGRKSCPTCGDRLGEGEWVWSWGEYVRAKWHMVGYFCRGCFKDRVLDRLAAHVRDCGCGVELVVRGAPRPDWLTLGKKEVTP